MKQEAEGWTNSADSMEEAYEVQLKQTNEEVMTLQTTMMQLKQQKKVEM